MKTVECGIALGLLSLSGCSLDPNYVRPESGIASTYPRIPRGEAAPREPTSRARAPDWRNFVKDARLQRLIEIALTNNRDLRVATLNVQAVQAQFSIQSATLTPQVSADASESRTRLPAQVARSGAVENDRSYSVGASLGWQIDVFGKLRSLRSAALQEYLASEQGRRAAQVLLVAQVVDQYLAVLAADELLGVTDETLEAAGESYDIVQLQFAVGAGSELDVRQAQTVVEQAQANRAAQLRARSQAVNGLVLLLGQAQPVEIPDRGHLSDQLILANLPEGLPSDLLEQRPDILEAEAVLRAANANIGAARAAFFPTIELTASGGTASTALAGLFAAGSAGWTFAPAVSESIFAGGAHRAGLRAAHVEKLIAVARYQKVVQTAFREVADGLAARDTDEQQIAALARFTQAQRRRLELAQLLYRDGQSNYLDVLTAQTDLYAARLTLVSARLQHLTSLVDLYRAVGGGWREPVAVASLTPDTTR